ncbi:MAG: Asp23/Gls24 family envelope stress response protein [Oscillospiraceae bacterium]|nr:Asp23/Gls24 family envelope stress response protein [Oscillospiraceae bacterium]
MEFKNTVKQEGGLKISVTVIEKVAKIAAMEVDGVINVSVGSSGMKGFLAKTNLPKAVEVNMIEGVADITVSIVVKYGVKLPAVCKEVQQVVKANVQNMTDITVSKVNIVVTGVETVTEE